MPRADMAGSGTQEIRSFHRKTHSTAGYENRKLPDSTDGTLAEQETEDKTRSSFDTCAEEEESCLGEMLTSH